jgi:UTP--glucose-1-phosphate uridylyltransferase
MIGFNTLYNKYINTQSPYLVWNEIEQIDNKIITDYDTLDNISNNKIQQMKNKICIIKLNGGLGTTMGCTGPKSLMEIKDDYKFIDIILEQSKLTPEIPILFMNSFYTHAQTSEYLLTNNNSLNIISFNQNCYPRIIKETKECLDTNSNNIDHLYPPGHGDLLQSLYDTNTLDKLIDMGIEYAFVSNSDNLGATVDFNILNDLIKNNIDYAIELTEKTKADVKGGTLIKYRNKYVMFEVAQCPPNKLEEFTSIEKFKYFNTNNIWIKLSAIKDLIQTNYLENVDIIINNKKLKDGRDCIQLEYAIGSMVKFFDKVKCYSVNRKRFIPVKTNNDLENIRSTNYLLNKKSWTLEKN